ncbi:MAG: hypothetical protein ACYDH9_16295 [Limisphaerales bacterium]
MIHCLLPLRTAIQIGADEGFELAKATLCLHGHRLYSEVWNDQPPLHTFLVTEILKRISRSVLGPRLLTVGLALILLTAVFLIGKRIGGLSVGVLATALLMASPGFLELSSSCMLEIPALAPVVTAVGLLLIVRRTKWPIVEVVAGVLGAVALQIKLISIIFFPLVVLVIWLRCRPNGFLGEAETAGQPLVPQATALVGTIARPSKLFNAISRFSSGNLVRRLRFFAVSLALSFVAIDYAIDGGAYVRYFQETWTSHFATARSFEYGSASDHPFDWSIFLKNWDTTIPAIFGIVVLARQVHRNVFAIVPLVWLGLMVVVFAVHRPWWSYYYVHLAIPLCLCGAVGLAAVWGRIRWRRAGLGVEAVALYLLCAVPWMVARGYLQIHGIRNSPQTFSCLALKEIGRLKPLAKWMYSDEPVYSFHAGIPMPPDLAVVPLKRLWAGSMTNERITSEMRQIKPEIILLRNGARDLPFQDLIDAEYRLVYQDSDHRLYTTKSLAKRAGY